MATFRPNLYRIGSSAGSRGAADASGSGSEASASDSPRPRERRVADVGISGGGGEAPSTEAGVPEGRLHVGGQDPDLPLEVADALLKRRMRLPEVGLHHPHPVVRMGRTFLIWRSYGSFAASETAVTRSKGLVGLASEHVGLPDGMV